MRLLDTRNGQFHEILNATDQPYAILSHTWDQDGEQSFEDLCKIQARYKHPGYVDIYLSYFGQANACACARAEGHKYLWIDSCCLDKSSSAEMSEAINAMYRWYEVAVVCYAYLSDVHSTRRQKNMVGEFFLSQWHTRGWTLQELLAPDHVIFLSASWKYLGTKTSLASVLYRRLGIPPLVLTKFQPVKSVCVAMVMSWATSRVTTREEDRAYCLMGLFGVHMPTLYGEGNRAFVRLQEAIWERTPDASVFAW
ncbi:uncharacterized protein TRAVEDRAFT_82850, partial [Trametes versicolor FP-101664 SS1]|uniref:uncharacterized protein n=1 Tax=Trametes versicolor (strain FP-101664) TaxID=717944 RepID=UPI0004623AD6